jgi:hypothetical protein
MRRHRSPSRATCSATRCPRSRRLRRRRRSRRRLRRSALAPKPDADAQPAVDVDQLRGFTTEDIESFKALGVEVLLHSETYGDVWLVPAYTGRERKEITPSTPRRSPAS